jgi:1-acyl-sn-glycerol-3-phosphate acyltransferase
LPDPVPPLVHETAAALKFGRNAFEAVRPSVIWEYARFYAVLASFGLLCLGFSLPARLLTLLLPQRLQPQLGRPGITFGFRAYLGLMRLAGLARFDLSALDRLRAEGGVIIVANHRSLIDAVLVLSRLSRIACIGKASLWNTALLSGSLRLAAYIRNDSPLAVIRGGVATLRRGEALLIFPEGTRAPPGAVLPFKNGFALMARITGASVQTVFLESNTSFLHKGWPPFRKPAFPLIYRARLGRRFEVTGEVEDFVAELEAYYRAELDPSARLRGSL